MFSLQTSRFLNQHLLAHSLQHLFRFNYQSQISFDFCFHIIVWSVLNVILYIFYYWALSLENKNVTLVQH